MGQLAVQGLLEAQPAENITALVRDAAKAADLAAPVGAAAGAGVATRKLLIGPPYSFCRNPMALGAIVLYGGVSVVAGSLGTALLVILGAAALLTYIQVVEEQEMVARFGEEYLAYRRRVPFLIPRLSWRRRKE